MKKLNLLFMAFVVFSSPYAFGGFCNDQLLWDVEGAVSGYVNGLYDDQTYIIELEMASLRYRRCITALS